jgi:hypothetical protein
MNMLNKRHRRRDGIFAMLLLLLCAASPEAPAQPKLDFRYVSMKWPQIQLFFTLSCDGVYTWNLSAHDVVVREDGKEVTGLTLHCPDPALRYAFSVAIVCDASGSMTDGAPPADTLRQLVAHGLVDLMDGIQDQAALIEFQDKITVVQSMTTSRPLLRAAIDNLYSFGASTMYDGVYRGLLELINRGVNPSRAIILISDGGDNASKKTPYEIAELARQHDIRVISVAFPTPTSAVSELQLISSLTNGPYYSVENKSQIAAVCYDIVENLSKLFQECVLSWERRCVDGVQRTVELEFPDYCGGAVADSKIVSFARDSATFTPISMRLGKTNEKGGENIVVPLELVAPILDEHLPPFQFLLEYDASSVSFLGAAAPPASLLEGAPISITTAAGAVLVQLTEGRRIRGTGLFMEFEFSSIETGDTLCSPIRAVDVMTEGDCFAPSIAEGEICVMPYRPRIDCSILAPDSLAWDTEAKDYQPAVFSVSARFRNFGDANTENARYRIVYNQDQFIVRSPLLHIQHEDISIGDDIEVTWQLSAKRQRREIETTVCITGMFDNHNDISCCVTVLLPQAGPVLDCTVDAPRISVNAEYLRHEPMPFPLTVTVSNTGGYQTMLVQAEILLPDGLTLAAPDGPDTREKRLQPSFLHPTQSGSVTWMLRHPAVIEEKEYEVSVRAWTENAADAICSIPVVIPGIPAVDYPVELLRSGPTRFCAGEFVVLDAGGGYRTYQWSSGETTRQIVVMSSGRYYCIVRDMDDRIGVSDTVDVTVLPLPRPPLRVTGPIPMCEGDSIQVDVIGIFREYRWNTGSAAPEITVFEEGMYFARVLDIEGCWGYSDTVHVTTIPAPAKPRVQRAYDVLSTDSATAWQWYINGIAIPSAVNRTHVMRVTGSYQVLVTNEHGCSTMSDPFEVTVLSLDAIPLTAERTKLTVYPEPTSDLLRISLRDVTAPYAQLLLTDMGGRSEALHSGALTTPDANFVYSLYNRPSGVYYVILIVGKEVIVRRVTRL